MKHKLSLVLSLGLAITFAGIGCALLPVSAEEVAEPVMENILQTVEGYKEAGAAQIRTTEKLTGEYSVTYSTTGVTPNNGWRSSLSDSTKRVLFYRLIFSLITTLPFPK